MAQPAETLQEYYSNPGLEIEFSYITTELHPVVVDPPTETVKPKPTIPTHHAEKVTKQPREIRIIFSREDRQGQPLQTKTNAAIEGVLTNHVVPFGKAMLTKLTRLF